MSATPIQPADWAPPRGYSNGMRARGEVLAVAGQIGWDAQGRLVDGGFVPQFRQALDNVASVVRTAGGAPTDIVSLTLYVIAREDYLNNLPEIGVAYRAVMGTHYPAMALLIVAGLVEPAARVEIQALAVLP